MTRGRHLSCNTIKKVIDTGADNKTPGQSHEDVTREVDAQIQTCPTVGERPDDEGYGEQTATNEPTEEDGNTESVGRMGRKKKP